MIYCFDLDGTICTSVDNSEYDKAMPDKGVVYRINCLYDLGHTIKIMTARGCVSGIDHTDLTEYQLNQWGVKYHELIMNKKPEADYFIDDKAINIYDWKRKKIAVSGVLAGAFDLIHPGYIKMFKEAKEQCEYLTVLLHSNPSLENGKPKPVHTIAERVDILKELRSVDRVLVYTTENELYNHLLYGDYDIRFLGSDYLNKKYTGPDLNIPIFWIERNHDYSTTDLKLKIKESM